MYASLAGAERQLVFTTLEVPGAVLTNAQGINARGDVVGFYIDTAGLNHGFLWRRGEFASIDVPGARVTAARGIGPNGKSLAPISGWANPATSRPTVSC